MSRLSITWESEDSGLIVDLTISTESADSAPADRVDSLARRALREVFDPINAQSEAGLR